MPNVIWNAITSTTRLTSSLQVLVFLPLTLSTLSQNAFLLLSFALTIHSVLQSCIIIALPTLAVAGRTITLNDLLPVLQVPVHPFLLLVCFNIFSATSLSPLVGNVAYWWGLFLRYSSPIFAGLEGLASLIVIQSAGIVSKELAAQSEGFQFLLLVASACAYCASSAWLFYAFLDDAASTPITAMLFGCSITSLLFLTGIGFALRRTNVVETSGVALMIAYNIWMCSNNNVFANYTWTSGISSQYTPLLENIIQHLETMFKFITHSFPRPLLAALLFRLSVLHFASRIVTRMGDEGWSDDPAEESIWENRPSSNLTRLVLAFRQTILIIVYSHLLLIDELQDVWWRWTNVFFTLTMWAVELLVWGSDEDGEHWKVD